MIWRCATHNFENIILILWMCSTCCCVVVATVARWATCCRVVVLGSPMCVLPMGLVALRVMLLLLLLLLWRHLWRSLLGFRLVAHSQFAMCVEHVCMCEVLIWCCSALGLLVALIDGTALGSTCRDTHCSFVLISGTSSGRYDRDWSPRCDPWLVMFSMRGFWMSCFWKPWWILIDVCGTRLGRHNILKNQILLVLFIIV